MTMLKKRKINPRVSMPIDAALIGIEQIADIIEDPDEFYKIGRDSIRDDLHAYVAAIRNELANRKDG